MQQENRRSFVKKSLATSVSISFAGLIRAHGEESGGTTISDTTAWETTYAFTSTDETTPSGDTTHSWETTIDFTYGTTCTTDFESTTTTTEDSTEETTQKEELISEKIKIITGCDELSGKNWPNTEKGQKDAMAEGLTRAAQLLLNCVRKDQVLGPVNGMIPCLEILPDQGQTFTIVTTELINGRYHYKITIPGGGIWYTFLFWKTP